MIHQQKNDQIIPKFYIFINFKRFPNQDKKEYLKRKRTSIKLLKD